MPTEKHAETLDPRLLDRRVVDRYLKRGQLDEKEYGKYLKSLPDLTEQSTRIETAFQPSGELGPSR